MIFSGSEVNSAYGDPDDFGPIIGTSKSSPSQNNYAGDDYHFHKIYCKFYPMQKKS